MSDLEYIVAEVSKNWDRGREVTPTGTINSQFEKVIEHNRWRGYRLHSFQLHRILTAPGAMNETIIAVFQKVTPDQPNPDPLPMLLFCPRCKAQHVDAPEPESGWANPPHRSHRCKECGYTWRPADVPTTGVEKLSTSGQNDWPADPRIAPAAGI